MQIFVKIGGYYFEISQFEKFVVTLLSSTVVVGYYKAVKIYLIGRRLKLKKNERQNNSTIIVD